MDNGRFLKILEDAGAIVAGHFILTSGRHSNTYFDKDVILPNPNLLLTCCQDIALAFLDDNISFVIGPAGGCNLMASSVATLLIQMTGNDIRTPFIKDGILRGSRYAPIQDKNVLIVDDVLTTGGSVGKVIEIARTNGGIIVGLGTIFDRTKVSLPNLDDIPKRFSLITLDLEDWSYAECPDWLKKIPVDPVLGHGR